MIGCPVCNKKKDIVYGKYICSDCKSRFEYCQDGKVVLIKSKKFDYGIFFISLILFVLFLVLFINDSTRESFYQSQKIFAGNVLIFLPFVMAIRQVFNLGLDAVTIFGLYIRFFRHELNKEDYGRIIGFYMTLIINLTGIFCIINGLME
jgi:uncharacterized integral membrane protein